MYTDILFADLGIWKSGYGAPTNYFVMFARHNNVDVAVDIAIGQFHRRKYKGLFIMPPVTGGSLLNVVLDKERINQI